VTGISFPSALSRIPAGVSSFEDDFPYIANGTTYSRWTVAQSNGTASAIAGTSNQNGVLQIQTGVVANARYAISRGLGQFIIPSNVFWQFNCGFSLPLLSSAADRYTIRAGLMDSNTGAPANGVWFEYSDNVAGGQWQCDLANGATIATPSGLFVTTGKQSLRAFGFGNTLAIFNINGVTAAGLSANFPAGIALGLVLGIFNSSATIQHNMQIDYAALYYNVSR
jgi:hypothetical protein